MKLQLINHRDADQIHRRWRHVTLYKQEVPGPSDDGVVRGFNIMSPTNDGEGTSMVLQTQADLGYANALQAVEARRYGGSLWRAYQLRCSVGTGG